MSIAAALISEPPRGSSTGPDGGVGRQRSSQIFEIARGLHRRFPLAGTGIQADVEAAVTHRASQGDKMVATGGRLSRRTVCAFPLKKGPLSIAKPNTGSWSSRDPRNRSSKIGLPTQNAVGHRRQQRRIPNSDCYGETSPADAIPQLRAHVLRVVLI